MPTLQDGDEGPEVLRLQQQLLDLGYVLPRWGADSSLGDETLAAAARFEADHGLPRSPDKKVDAGTVDAIARLWGQRSSIAPSGFSDETGKHDGRQRVKSRAWTAVKGITLHQTACVLGEKAQRWHTLAAHVGVTAAGQILLVNPLCSVVWHGNGFNTDDVGVEIDGHFEGIQGDPHTLWRPSNQPDLMGSVASAAQLQAARDAVRWICDEVARHGGHVQNIHAHRMSSADRRSDPGSQLWREVGLWARDTLALSDQGAGFCIGGGRPVPEAWDPSRTGIAY